MASVFPGLQLSAGGRHFLWVGSEEVVPLFQTLWRRSGPLAVTAIMSSVLSFDTSVTAPLYCCQENSTPGLAAGGSLMGKWFLAHSAPTSTNPEPLAATATTTPADHHGNIWHTVVVGTRGFVWTQGRPFCMGSFVGQITHVPCNPPK